MTLHRGLGIDVDGLDNGTTPKGHRLADGGLLGKTTGGVVRPGVLVDGMGKVVSGSGAGMSYNVRACQVVCKASDANGPTISAIDATENIALADDGSTLTAPGSNSRIDVIYAIQDLVTADGAVGSGTSNAFRVAVKKGNAAGSPGVPEIPTGATELSRTTVAAGISNTAALIFSDPVWATANGGIVPDSKGAATGKVWNGTDMVPVGIGHSAWTIPALNTGWSHVASGVKYKLSGGWVIVTLNRADRGGGAGNVVFTLPPGFRPQETISGAGEYFGAVRALAVTAAGDVISPGASGVAGSLVFPIL